MSTVCELCSTVTASPLQGVDCELKEASGPGLLSCDWLSSRGPVDELDSD